MALEFIIIPTEPLTISLTGDLTLGPQLRDFSRKTHALLAQQPPKGLILHLGGIHQIDSAGLGELVILYTTTTQRGGRFCLAEPTPRIVRLLESTKLAGLFPLFPNAAAALHWLNSIP